MLTTRATLTYFFGSLSWAKSSGKIRGEIQVNGKCLPLEKDLETYVGPFRRFTMEIFAKIVNGF